MLVNFSNLPKDIQLKIPISIRSYSREMELAELPAKIQELVRPYLINDIPITYKVAYDLKPAISKYSDYYVTSSIKETISEYLKNYFYTLPGSYPFDPTFGCKLKYYLQTRDTQLRRLLIVDEINTIVNVLSSDLSLAIKVNNVSIIPMSSALDTSITCAIDISIPGEENIKITLTSLGPE